MTARLATLLLFFALTACERIDRARDATFDLIVRFVPLSVDVALGDSGFRSMQSQIREVTDPAVKRLVMKIAQPLIQVAQRDTNLPYRIHVTADDTVNAYALPGGRVILPVGLIRFARSADEVAGVLSHELAHAARRHGTKQMAANVGLMLAFQLLLGDASEIVAFLAARGSDLLLLEHSRDHESEADSTGASYLIGAGVSVAGLTSFFEKLAAREQKSGSTPAQLTRILSTHPVNADRIAALRKLSSQTQVKGRALLDEREFAELKRRVAPKSG